MRGVAVILVLVASVAAATEFDTAIDCRNCDSWNQPQDAFRIHGNTWYVGVQGLSAILIETGDGLILLDGHIFTGTGHNKGFPLSLEMAAGEVAWGPVRNEGGSSAAVSYADGRLYFRYQDGLMVLVEATPEAYREHGSFMIPEMGNFSWSHPVISDGKLYLREQDNLFCYEVRRSASVPAAWESPSLPVSR